MMRADCWQGYLNVDVDVGVDGVDVDVDIDGVGKAASLCFVKR